VALNVIGLGSAQAAAGYPLASTRPASRIGRLRMFSEAA